jgi:hypothetical protein
MNVHSMHSLTLLLTCGHCTANDKNASNIIREMVDIIILSNKADVVLPTNPWINPFFKRKEKRETKKIQWLIWSVTSILLDNYRIKI